MATLTEHYASAASLAKDSGASREAARHWLAGRVQVPLNRCVRIERATSGAVRCEDLRPDVDWVRNAAGAVTGYHVRLDPPKTEAA